MEIKNNWNASGFLEPDISQRMPLPRSITKCSRMGRKIQAGGRETLFQGNFWGLMLPFDLRTVLGREFRTRFTVYFEALKVSKEGRGWRWPSVPGRGCIHAVRDGESGSWGVLLPQHR